MPYVDQYENLFYEFKLGPVQFISINTEAYYFLEYGIKLVVKQYTWLVEVLKVITYDMITITIAYIFIILFLCYNSFILKEANKPENRAKWPWIITYGHRPMYCSNDDGDDCTKKSSRVRSGLPVLNW